MAEHIAPKMRTHNGGSRISSESAAVHAIQSTPRRQMVPITVEGPEPNEDRYSPILLRAIYVLLGMALAATLILAAGRG